ncbi:hypothetical protein BKA82DRAFT_32290 [Pisolithus tinctorius]|uniref:Lipoyl-binding domain-containing protein n=1 Tax=Pisolithus tinctorius Marx 270 TaxID=870435 RepID=A0A0C3NPC8_PISTI|nr:hypothetical protein BKA82DRAFT_32290 [Pisolithus tinctorius]KIN97425.1 hypothetical protein M404DRAFT_32290 [Pisolithus tinctorius Marx 270]
MKEQSAIQSFDPLCEVQSDKASVEIAPPYDGVVKQFLVDEEEVSAKETGQGELSHKSRSPVQKPIQTEGPHMASILPENVGNLHHYASSGPGC